MQDGGGEKASIKALTKVKKDGCQTGQHGGGSWQGQSSQDPESMAEIMMPLDCLTINPVKEQINLKAKDSLPCPLNTRTSCDIYCMDPGQNYIHKR